MIINFYKSLLVNFPKMVCRDGWILTNLFAISINEILSRVDLFLVINVSALNLFWLMVERSQVFKRVIVKNDLQVSRMYLQLRKIIRKLSNLNFSTWILLCKKVLGHGSLSPQPLYKLFSINTGKRYCEIQIQHCIITHMSIQKFSEQKQAQISYCTQYL